MSRRRKIDSEQIESDPKYSTSKLKISGYLIGYLDSALILSTWLIALILSIIGISKDKNYYRPHPDRMIGYDKYMEQDIFIPTVTTEICMINNFGADLVKYAFLLTTPISFLVKPVFVWQFFERKRRRRALKNAKGTQTAGLSSATLGLLTTFEGLCKVTSTVMYHTLDTDAIIHLQKFYNTRPYHESYPSTSSHQIHIYSCLFGLITTIILMKHISKFDSTGKIGNLANWHIVMMIVHIVGYKVRNEYTDCLYLHGVWCLAEHVDLFLPNYCWFLFFVGNREVGEMKVGLGME